MKTIRIGMIRCDVHAVWYSLLFQPADEQQLLRHFPQCQYYFYYRHNLKFGLREGFELVKVYDPFPQHGGVTYVNGDQRTNAQMMSDIFLGTPRVCQSLGEVSDDVDVVFIADCLENGKDHLALATPGLNKGVPTFVDKPFAFTLADVRAMIDLAQQNDTAVMSASLLRVNPKIDQFRRRFAEIEQVGSGVVRGVGADGQLNAQIHGLSLAQHVFGEGVEFVQSMGDHPLQFVRLHYPANHPKLKDGIDVMVLLSPHMGPNCGARCEVYSHRGSVHSEWIDDYVFPLGGHVVLDMIRNMVMTREPSLSYASMIELFSIVEAGRRSHAEGGRRIDLKDV